MEQLRPTPPSNGSQRAADIITAFCGSLAFVWLHMAWFSGWIALNGEGQGSWRFDPYPFGLLTLIVSLEAIFLSTFILISQNRQATKDRLVAEETYRISRQMEAMLALMMNHLQMIEQTEQEQSEAVHEIEEELQGMEERRHEHL